MLGIRPIWSLNYLAYIHRLMHCYGWEWDHQVGSFPYSLWGLLAFRYAFSPFLRVYLELIVFAQLNALTYAYTLLMKDKQILSSETMREYNDGVSIHLRIALPHAEPIFSQFVYRRINPIRKDVAVMTHQSEVVNVWEK